MTSARVKTMLATILVGTKATLATATSMLVATILKAVITTKATTIAEIESSSRRQRNFQTENKLNIEIENIRRLMMKVSKKKKTTTRKQRNFSKGKTRTEYESTTSGKLQNKIWKPGEVQQKNNAAYGHQQNRVWDPGGKDSKHMIRRS